MKAVTRVLVVVLVALAGLQLVRSQRLLSANRMLYRAESEAAALAARRTPAAEYEVRIRGLEQAARLDPADSRIPMAVGSYYFLLRRFEPASTWYRRSLDLAARPEAFLNLCRAEHELSREAEALEACRRAVLLDRTRLRQVPEPIRERVRKKVRRAAGAGPVSPAVR